MTEVTNIEWCDSTFNPWVGCTKISQACDHCYAESWAKRSGQVQWGNEPRKRTSPQNWNEPRRWQRLAGDFFAQHGRRRRVFCASLADVFDNQVPTDWRVDLWALIRETPDIDWLLLTKRPQNIDKMLPEYWDEVKGHVWLGTTVENQQSANQNIPHLLKHDSAVRFLSCEPLLAPIDLRPFGLNVHHHPDNRDSSHLQALIRAVRVEMQDGLAIDWVIAGGESGPGARPSHPDWYLLLRDQCAAAGVPFLFKQWGEWCPRGPASWGYPVVDGVAQMRMTYTGTNGQDLDATGGNDVWLNRAGKTVAGRLLDGAEYNGFPELT